VPRPDDAEVADTLGWILTQRGNPTRAVQVLRKAAAIAPKNPAIRYHLAQAWLKTGDKDRARDELEALLSGNPKFPDQAEAHRLLDQIRSGAR
jgi:Flp pilus assembly protein TadD